MSLVVLIVTPVTASVYYSCDYGAACVGHCL